MRPFHQHMFNVLQAAQQERPKRPHFDEVSRELGWITYERDQMFQAVNLERARLNKSAIELKELMSAERCATGHVDYTTKFALYCAELIEKP